MKGAAVFAFLLALMSLSFGKGVDAAEKPSIKWQSWSPAVFEKAKKEKLLVLLDLEAIWCHWCHVMDEVTYQDPKVIELINSKYIAVKVDQDSRPDISNRYEDYGWPATIFFNSEGNEIVKRSGYIPPPGMAALLQAMIDDPTPGPSVGPAEKMVVPESPFLSKKDRAKINAIVRKHYDFKKGSWDIDHKLLDGALVEYLMREGHSGMAIQTLNKQLLLIDPAWGGVYQYSVGGDWNEPHFEKIMSVQAENLRIYALAYNKFGDVRYLKAANEINGYLINFLMSSDGAFYTSQDADLVQGEHGGEFFRLDDKDRRKKGMPRIDKNVYSRENGWVINALAALYMATGNEDTLKEATRAASWIIKNRKQKAGCYTHDVKDPVGPYLGDSLAMGNALLSLYRASGERHWLKESEETAKYITENFGGGVGFVTTKPTKADVFPPIPQADENVQAARYFNLLSQFTGNKVYRLAAERAMRFLASPQVSEKFFVTPGILLADSELGADPLHITVLGGKSDPVAKTLFLAGAKYPVPYKRLEWWDKKEGPLPQQDVQFPDMPTAAVFACSGDRCSLPAKSPEELEKRIKSMLEK